MNLKTILSNLLNAPLFASPGFYIGLFGLVVTFAPRFGVTFTQAEIGQVAVFIGLVFGITPPTLQFMQVKMYEARVQAEQTKAQTHLDPIPRPFETLRSHATPPPPPPVDVSPQ